MLCWTDFRYFKTLLKIFFKAIGLSIHIINKLVPRSLSSTDESFEISFLLHNIRFLNCCRTDSIIFYFLQHFMLQRFLSKLGYTWKDNNVYWCSLYTFLTNNKISVKVFHLTFFSKNMKTCKRFFCSFQMVYSCNTVRS